MLVRNDKPLKLYDMSDDYICEVHIQNLILTYGEKVVKQVAKQMLELTEKEVKETNKEAV